MKKFVGAMLSIIVLTLIASSVQVVIADDKLRLKTSSFDPDFNVGYEVYVQTTIRDAQGQLLSVSESTNGWIMIPTLPNGIQILDFVDYVFDSEFLSEKEVITIDGVKYEKIQFLDEEYTAEILYSICPSCAKVEMTSGIIYEVCGDFEEYGYHCIPIFKANTPQMHITEGNTVTQQWTILRVMN
tara:strand:- start:48 stop:602 length:555 start_codon:yes stop_codon:yes gene_type:complete